MSDPFQYEAAWEKLHEAEEAISQIATRLISFAGDLMERRGSISFHDLPDEPQPDLSQLVDGPSYSILYLPTAAEIQLALRDRFRARQRLHDIWDGLTDQQRKGAPLPPR